MREEPGIVPQIKVELGTIEKESFAEKVYDIPLLVDTIISSCHLFSSAFPPSIFPIHII